MKLGLTLLATFLLVSCNTSGDGRIEATGTMEAIDVTVSALVSGTVLSIQADEGSKVAAGDTLAVIDQRDLILQLRQAEANLAAAEAQYRLTVLGARKEDVTLAEVTYENARRDLERMRELRTTNSIPQKQLEDVELRATIARQTLEKIKNGARPEEVSAVAARRDQASAQVASLRKKVEDCFVTSPTSGTVINRFIERGEFAAPGSALFRVADLQELDLMIFVPETELPQVTLGQKATISVDAFDGRTFEGKVLFISSTAEFTPKNIQTKDERTKLVFGVKIRVQNPDGALKAGIPADVVL